MFTLPTFPAAVPRPPSAPATALDLAALVGAAAWGRLPPAVQRRFDAAHADAAYAGEMALHCSRIGRLYAWLTRPFGGPLLAVNADAVPAMVRVYRNRQGGVVWERWFQRGAGPARAVRSTKELGPGGGLVERTDGGLSMLLEVFEQDGALVFRSRRFALVRGRLRIPIPLLLAPGVCQVTHTDLGAGRFRFTLSMQHPLWGETFHQAGVFTDPQEA